MRKIAFLALSLVFLSGCAAYKFQKGQPPYDKGYVASREGYTIVEYTIGNDNTVPQKVALAKERFKRRRRVVEDYYKKMGNIENRLKEAVVDYPVMLFKLALGVFKMPGIAVKDYRYERNPKYKERIDRLEDKKEAREQERIDRLKAALNEYIRKDLEKEGPVVQVKTEEPAEKPAEKIQELPVEEAEKPQEASVANVQEEKIAPPKVEVPVMQTPVIEEKEPEKIIEAPVLEQIEKTSAVTKELDKHVQINAVIVASPEKGFSPLIVHFSGGKSHSKSGKIISHSWDFGDGDSSLKANTVNTYYSGSFEPKEFIVTLTVQDDKGNVATISKPIKVLNK